MLHVDEHRGHLTLGETYNIIYIIMSFIDNLYFREK